MATIFGYIFNWETDDVSPNELESLYLKALNASSSIITTNYYSNSDYNHNNLKNWKQLKIESKEPLMGEDVSHFQKDTFVYPFYTRINRITGNIIIGAARYTITEKIRDLFNSSNDQKLAPIFMNVDIALTQLLRYDERKFSITHLMADVSGYGAAINTISLNGDDIASAQLVHKERKNITARQLGIRPNDVDKECLNFTNTGKIKFYSDRINHLEPCLNFINEQGIYIF